MRSYSFLSLFFLWFGAAISIAEILTAGMLADAGLQIGIWAILLAHIAGFIIMALMGIIGFQTKKPSLVCTRRSFGLQGSWFLSLANVIQLVGWTAVMLQQGGQALAGILTSFGQSGDYWQTIFIILLGCLVALWAWWEAVDKTKANILAVLMLIGLCCVLSFVLIQNPEPIAKNPSLGFGSAFELVFIMPLSWFLLVADYTCKADKFTSAAIAPALAYFIAGVWMYFIGFFGALVFNQADPVTMLLAAGFGFVALGVVGLSALTTTFLDVYSAAVSASNILPNISKKIATTVIVIIGTFMALIWDSNLYTSLLHLIGSVFAPISAIICYDYFILKIDLQNSKCNWQAFLSLAIGIGLYYIFNGLDLVLGASFSCLLATLLIHIAVRKIFASEKKESLAN